MLYFQNLGGQRRSKTTLNELASYYVNTNYADRGRGIGSSPSNPEEYASKRTACVGWSYNADKTYTTDVEGLKKIGSLIDAKGNPYWLGSLNYWDGGFGVRYISSTGTLSTSTFSTWNRAWPYNQWSTERRAGALELPFDCFLLLSLL